MRVEIYSDVVCPWCYIGKRRFEAALERFDGEVEVVWRPYQLDPGAPAEPTPVAEAYARKFGGPDQAAALIDRITATAADEGLTFDLGRAQRANTFRAHRLAWWAGDHQGVLEEALFRAYFVDGRDVNDPETLADLAAEVGIDREAASAFLASDVGTVEVRALLEGALDREVTAVPTFIFEDRWTVPGAQEADTMLRVLQTVAERLSPSA